jgi:hypothetical protein
MEILSTRKSRASTVLTLSLQVCLYFNHSSNFRRAVCCHPDYTGGAAGHFGDSIQYVDDSGKLTQISGASSSWGCSHNTGIAFEAADAPPYASICAEDHE